MFLARYAYSGDVGDEFDKEDTNLTLIKPLPVPSKDARGVPEARSTKGSDGAAEADLEEEKTE